MSKDKNYLRLAHLIAHKSKSYAVIKEILEDGDINYQIPLNSIQDVAKKKLEGCTALHIIQDSNAEAVELLIKQGADCTIKNALGETAIHEAIICFSDNFSEATKGQLCHPIIDTILNSYISGEISGNPCNNNGLSHFHAACIVNHTKAVEFFIKEKVPINEAVKMNSPYVPGYTPLHFAARYSCRETFEILLEAGADLHAKDLKGVSPLYLLIRRNLDINNLICFYKMVLSDKSKKELIENYKMLDIALTKYRNTGKNVIIDDIGLSYLHVNCIQQGTAVIEQILSNDDSVKLDQSIKEDSCLWPGYTALHIAAHHNIDAVQLLLKRGANMLAKDVDGVTPLDLCLQRYSVDKIHAIIKNHENWKNIKLSDEKTTLLEMVYAMRSENSLETFLSKDNVNTYIPDNYELLPGCTPLHLAVMLTERVTPEDDGRSHLERIRIILGAGADVAIVNSSGSTPIHLAFELKKSKVVNLLLQRTPKLIDRINENNLSHLHIACAAGNSIAIENMLDWKTNVNLPLNRGYSFKKYIGGNPAPENYFFTTGSTPLHVAVITKNIPVTKLLVCCGANVNAKDIIGLTPIHRLLEPEKVGISEKAMGEILFSSNSLMDSITSFGLSHLHVACWIGDVPTVEKLLDQGANVNSITISGSECDPKIAPELLGRSMKSNWAAIDFALSSGHGKTIDVIFKRHNDIQGDPITILRAFRHTKKSKSIISLQKTHAAIFERWEKEYNLTPLHAACHRRDQSSVEELLKQGADPNIRVSQQCTSWPGLTPLQVLLDYDFIEENNVYVIVKLLIDYGADVMLRNSEGNTVIHETVRYYGMKYKHTLLLLLESQKAFDENPALYNQGITHFHVACACDAVGIVEKFLEHGVDVNQAIDPMIYPFENYTPLHLAALYKSESTVELLLKHGANVHARNRDRDTPLHCAVNYEHRRRMGKEAICETIIESLIGAGADVCAINIWGETASEILLKTQKPSNKLLSILSKRQLFVNAFNNADGTGVIATAIKRETSIKNIIEHPIYQAVIRSPRINGKSECGRTPIHNIVSIRKVAASVNNYTKAIERFLNVGLDIDQKDQKGQTALYTAVRFKNAKATAALLALGANINLTCAGVTPYFYHWRITMAQSTDLTKLLESERCIFKLLSKHVYKLQLINATVVQSDEIIEDLFRERVINQDLNFVEQCQVELEQLETRKIEPYDITLFDFLSETGVVSSYPNMIQLKRRGINDFFYDRSLRLRQNFPEFAGILLMHHRKAVTRMTLIEPAKNALNSLLEFHLPDVCVDAVLQFLKNFELQDLIDSIEIFSMPSPKRKKID